MTVKQRAFLAAISVCPFVGPAAAIAKVGRRSHYDWMADPEYAAAFADAREEAIERLEAVTYKSAMEGIAEPVIYQGRMCFEPLRNPDGEVLRDPETGAIQYSNNPLVVYKVTPTDRYFLLKSMRPDIYRDNATVEHTGAGGEPLSIKVEFVKPAA